MSKLKANITMSLDGFVSGPIPSAENPLGIGGLQLHEWILSLKTFRETHGEEGGEVNSSTPFAEEILAGVGASIMGRNMFGGGPGPWGKDAWTGFWGENPPFHHPVFVLSHHPREPLEMTGGTTFYFVTDGIESALEQARAAAGDGDVSLGGGAGVVQQYLTAGLLDEIVVSLVPIFLGEGVRLFANLGEPAPDPRAGSGGRGARSHPPEIPTSMTSWKGESDMQTVTSSDGTTIAFDRSGAGPPVILVGGATQYREFDPSTADLAARLADRFTVLNYDRRGRGDSGDTAPYAVEREVEDLDALIGHVGGSAALYGSSSGGNLALEAAIRGVGVTALALWEPNFLVDDSRPSLPDDYVAQLEEHVAAGRRGDAVEYFLTTAAGVPAEYLGPMRDSPMWAGMEQVAHTLAYDGRVVNGFRLRADRVAAVEGPALIMDGGQTPWMSSGAEALADALPNGTHRRLEGQEHGPSPEVIAPVLIEFFAAA